MCIHPGSRGTLSGFLVGELLEEMCGYKPIMK